MLCIGAQVATYLQLVNEAIRESGANIDQLSAIVTTGNTIQSKFCNWTIQAWEDIQTDTNGWDFLREYGAYTVVPRIHFYDGTTTYETTTSMEDIELTPDGWTTDLLTIKYFSPVSGSAISTQTTGYIDLKVVPDEPLDRAIPTGLELTTVDDASNRGFTGYFLHWGRYDLNEATTPALVAGSATSLAAGATIAEVNWTTFKLYDDAPNRPAYTGTEVNYSESQAVPLVFMEWDSFVERGLSTNASLGKPQIVTQAPDGTVQFYPNPDKSYMATFTYTALPQTFSAASDTPTNLPTRFHRAITWVTIMKYALYDNQNMSLYRRAEMEYNKILGKMNRDLKPKVAVSHNYLDW